MQKIKKIFHAYRGYASTSNVETLNSFNIELQPKDTESAFRNELKALLTELKRFKLVKTLVSKFKQIERDDETKYTLII